MLAGFAISFTFQDRENRAENSKIRFRFRNATNEPFLKHEIIACWRWNLAGKSWSRERSLFGKVHRHVSRLDLAFSFLFPEKIWILHLVRVFNFAHDFPATSHFRRGFFVLSSTSKVFCCSPKYESSMADSSLNSRRRSFSYFHSQFCMKGNKAEFHFTFKNTSSSCLVISPWAEFTKSAAKIQSR